MTGKPRRRVRIRRKRRSGGSLLDADDVGDAVETFGCCLIELVLASATAMVLIAVPVGLLLD